MRTAVTDDVIRTLISSAGRRDPLEGLHENGSEWGLGTFGILKHGAGYSDGWGHSLRPESRFYKRWFEFPDLDKRGWAIIFRIFDPVGEPAHQYESFPGWVPADRAAEADEWIAFLNARIAERLSASAAQPTPPRPAG